MPLPPALVPRPGGPPPAGAELPAPSTSTVTDLATAASDRPNIDGNPVDVVADTLACLTAATPPDRRSAAHLPEAWRDLSYKA